jgi:hypothetical protein
VHHDCGGTGTIAPLLPPQRCFRSSSAFWCLGGSNRPSGLTVPVSACPALAFLIWGPIRHHRIFGAFLFGLIGECGLQVCAVVPVGVIGYVGFVACFWFRGVGLQRLGIMAARAFWCQRVAVRRVPGSGVLAELMCRVSA